MIKKIIKLGMMVVAMALATSCSNGKMGEMLDLVPVNSEVAIVGDVETVLKSAGGEFKDGEIKLPSNIENELPSSMSRELDNLNEMIHDAGINPEVACMAHNQKFIDYRNIFIFKVKNEDKLLSYLDDKRFREQDEDDGLTIYVKKEDSGWSSRNTYVGLKGSYIYVMPDVFMFSGSEFEPERAMKKFVEAAKEESLGNTKAAKYVAEANAAGIVIHFSKEMRREMRRDIPSDMMNLFEGYICMRADLKDENLSITYKMFSEDGNERSMEDFAKLMNTEAKINPEALTYLSKDENQVMAVSLKDVKWNKYLDQISEAAEFSRSDKAIMDVISGYLKKVDGTVAVGYGMKGGVDGFIDIENGYKPFETMSFTLVAETKDNKAKGVVNDLKTMMDSYGFPYEATSTGFTIDIDNNSKLYGEAKGNYVIFANHKIKQEGSPAVKAINFSDYIAAGSFVFTKNSKLMTDLGINNDIIATFSTDAKSCEATFNIEIRGGKAKGFVGKLLGIIIDVVANEKKIQEKSNKRYEQIMKERNSYYHEEYATDSVAYVDYAAADYYATDSVAW